MVRETKKIVTKKHQARLEREEMQTRYILIGTVAVIALVVLLIGYGALSEIVLKNIQPVAKVNGETINRGEFIARLSYSSLNYGANDPSIYGFIAESVIEELITDRLVRQEARKLGISASSDEVTQRVYELLGFYANGTPVPSATPEKRATSTLSSTQVALISPTPTRTATATATEGPTATPDAALTATAVIPTATAGPTATAAPSPTPLTAEGVKTRYSDLVEFLSTNSISEGDLRKIIEGDLLREKLMVELLPTLPWEQDQVWARQIVVTSEVTATQIIADLQAGGDFGELAAKYNTDAATQFRNGDLGWLARGVQSDAFDEVAFTLAVGEFTQTPIVTEDGKYIILQIVGRDMRPLQNDFERFNAWLAEKRQQATVEIFDWQAMLPVVATPTP